MVRGQTSRPDLRPGLCRHCSRRLHYACRSDCGLVSEVCLRGSGMSYEVRGADCTVCSKEMARAERGRKLPVNMAIIQVFSFGVFEVRIYGMGDSV